MNRTRVMLATYVDLDPVPGTFHTIDSARHTVNKILKQSIPHYMPIVGMISLGRTFYNLTFDHNNRNWTQTLEYNMLFVKSNLAYLNDRLMAQGYLFLNEVHDALGMSKTREGQIVGWVADGPISWDWQPIDETANISIKFHSHGCIIDKAFEEDM